MPKADPPYSQFSSGPETMCRWASQTIYHALQIKAKHKTKHGQEPAQDLMREFATEEAARLFEAANIPGKSRAEVVLEYYESVFMWCQKHMTNG